MEDKETISLTSAEYRKLLKFAGGNPRLVLKLPKIRNKNIIITDSLDLSRSNIDNLEGIIEVKGYLNISNTNISNISHIKVGRYTSDSNTPLERKRLRKIKQDRLEQLKLYEVRGLFNIENDTEESNKVNALYEYFVDENIIDPEYQDKILALETNLEELQGRLESIGEDNIIYGELKERIDEIENEIYELHENNFGLYSIFPVRYGSNRDYYIVIEGENTTAYDKTFIVLTDDECTQYATENINSLYDDMDMSNMDLDDYVDGDEVRESFEGTIDEWVRESPESYLDEDDMELTESQMNEIDILRSEAETIEYKIGELEDEDEIEELRDRLTEIESEIESIEEEKTYSEEAIENYVSNWLDNIKDDPVSFLKEMGYDSKFIAGFVDKDAWVMDVLRSDGEEQYILHGEGPLGYSVINRVGYHIYYEDGGSL